MRHCCPSLWTKGSSMCWLKALVSDTRLALELNRKKASNASGHIKQRRM